jgi:hypothetical protein
MGVFCGFGVVPGQDNHGRSPFRILCRTTPRPFKALDCSARSFGWRTPTRRHTVWIVSICHTGVRDCLNSDGFLSYDRGWPLFLLQSIRVTGPKLTRECLLPWRVLCYSRFDDCGALLPSLQNILLTSTWTGLDHLPGNSSFRRRSP